MSKKKYSINDYAAQLMKSNQNSIELLTKLDQSLNSNESFVTAKTVDSLGKEVTTQIPTVGFLKQKLDQLTKMVKTMSGLENNTSSIQIEQNSFKRIITADINKEPNQISELAPISTFKTDPNWIFDTFLNPMISVELDLTGRIDLNCNTILSKRFIVKFDKYITQENGEDTVKLTTDAEVRLQEFKDKYKGKSNINIVEFATWLDSPGLVNRIDENLIDQDKFSVEPNRLKFKGDFSVTNTELDTVNKKLWYVLQSMNYLDISDLNLGPKQVELKIGDLIKVNPISASISSATVYKVVEISTITSDYRVRFEQVFGEEPIPVRLNGISIYSEVVPTKSVKISVAFDEYSVLFVKQLDSTNNIIGTEWSPGIGFYTNELRLNSNTGELFSDYYVNTVYDYGIVLQDLVAKKTPNYYGIKPNSPILQNDNFKVVQINSHLTQTVEAEKIRDLHNEKNNVAAQVQQIQTAIEKQNRLISITNFTSNADKKRADDQLFTLISKLDTKNKSKTSIITDILASKKNLNKISPVFHARGFFAMPEAIFNTKTKPQEIVQFEIWYRKLSKSGDENPILTVTNINSQATTTTTNFQKNILKPKVVNGAFSNWTKYTTDARKREQDLITGEWKWKIEDVSDANTPNINQVDLPILPGERIEIKIKSLSEVGWPETPVESEFSNTLIIDFPDDLNTVLNEDEFILKEAQGDEIKVSFQRDLESMGLNLHLATALRDSDIYYAHKADSISSGFRDSNGKIINLYDQLLKMNQKINSLEESISRAKGILEIYLINKGNKTKLFSGNNLTFNLNLEDHMTPTKIGLASNPVDSISRTYKNELILIEDFQLQIKNTANTADLGILSYRGYGQPAGKQPATFAYNHKNDLTLTRIVQPTWIKPDSTILINEISENISTNIQIAPKYATQQNNQWIWLHAGDTSGKDIYHGNILQPSNHFFDPLSTNFSASGFHQAIITKDKNIGFLTGTDQILANNTGASLPNIEGGTIIDSISNNLNWEALENPTVSTTVGTMGSTIHPVINDFNSITDTSSQLIKFIKPGESNDIIIPLNIYAKAYTGTGTHKIAIGTPDPDQASKYFDDSAYTSLAELRMPKVDSTLGNIHKSGTGQLTIKIESSSIPAIKEGDRIIINGLSNAGLMSSANNKILTVTNVATTIITVNYDASILTTAIDEPAVKIIQLHKHYIETGSQLHNYNVLGKITGNDSRYVNNYIEIVSKDIPNPITHNKKLRFYLEDENNIRPIEFQFNFEIKQYKPTLILGKKFNLIQPLLNF